MLIKALADLGGVPGVFPYGTQFFRFSPKSTRAGGWHPPTDFYPPPAGNPESATVKYHTEDIWKKY